MSSTNNVAAATAALGDWYAENDLYAIAMPSGIKFTQQQLLAGLALVKTQFAPQGDQGKAVVAGLDMYVPEAWMKRLMTVSARMMKMYPGGEELTDEQAGKLAELSAHSLKGLHSMAMVLGVGQAGAPLYGDTVLLMNVDSAQEYTGDQLSGDASVKKTLGMLLVGSQWVGLGSHRGTLQFMARTMSQVVPNLPIRIPEFPETSPIGFAMNLTPSGLETDLAIPTDVLQATAEVINKARGAQPAGVPK